MAHTIVPPCPAGFAYLPENKHHHHAMMLLLLWKEASNKDNHDSSQRHALRARDHAQGIVRRHQLQYVTMEKKFIVTSSIRFLQHSRTNNHLLNINVDTLLGMNFGNMNKILDQLTSCSGATLA